MRKGAGAYQLFARNVDRPHPGRIAVRPRSSVLKRREVRARTRCREGEGRFADGVGEVMMADRDDWYSCGTRRGMSEEKRADQSRCIFWEEKREGLGRESCKD